MNKLFGTDGVRGVANVEPMTSETALKLGRAAAYLFKSRQGGNIPITRVHAYRIINEAVKAVGVTDRIGTHIPRVV